MGLNEPFHVRNLRVDFNAGQIVDDQASVTVFANSIGDFQTALDAVLALQQSLDAYNNAVDALNVLVRTQQTAAQQGGNVEPLKRTLAELEANVDSLIVVLNEKLLEVMGDDVTQEQAFAHANDVLKNAVGGISDIIHMPGLVNVDFEDVKTVMSEPGKAMMGTAHSGGPDRATKAAELAVACPLLEGIDLSGARGVLVLIAASEATFKLNESKNAMNTIRRYAADDAHVIERLGLGVGVRRFGDRNAELVLALARRDVVVRVGVHIRVHPQRDGRHGAHRRGSLRSFGATTALRRWARAARATRQRLDSAPAKSRA